jgi:hypothetical protein
LLLLLLLLLLRLPASFSFPCSEQFFNRTYLCAYLFLARRW